MHMYKDIVTDVAEMNILNVNEQIIFNEQVFEYSIISLIALVITRAHFIIGQTKLKET